jgi:hypothetical protein
VLMSKIKILKNIILMYFQLKNTLHYNTKHTRNIKTIWCFNFLFMCVCVCYVTIINV